MCHHITFPYKNIKQLCLHPAVSSCCFLLRLYIAARQSALSADSVQTRIQSNKTRIIIVHCHKSFSYVKCIKIYIYIFLSG